VRSFRECQELTHHEKDNLKKVIEDMDTWLLSEEEKPTFEISGQQKCSSPVSGAENGNRANAVGTLELLPHSCLPDTFLAGNQECGALTWLTPWLALQECPGQNMLIWRWANWWRWALTESQLLQGENLNSRGKAWLG
jgi:hypothetical protein